MRVTLICNLNPIEFLDCNSIFELSKEISNRIAEKFNCSINDIVDLDIPEEFLNKWFKLNENS